MPENSPLTSLQLWGVQHSCIAVAFNMKTGIISLVASIWKSNIPRPLQFLHYSVGIPQLRQSQGGLSADLSIYTLTSISLEDAAQKIVHLFFATSLKKVYNLDTLFLALCSEYFCIVLFHEGIVLSRFIYYHILLN